MTLVTIITPTLVPIYKREKLGSSRIQVYLDINDAISSSDYIKQDVFLFVSFSVKKNRGGIKGREKINTCDIVKFL